MKLKICTTADLAEVCRRLNEGDGTVFVRDVNSVGSISSLLSIAKGPFTLRDGEITGFSLQGVRHVLKLGGPFGTTIALKREGGEWYEPGMGSHILEM